MQKCYSSTYHIKPRSYYLLYQPCISRDTVSGKLKLFSKDKGYMDLEQDILLSAIKGALEKQTNPFVLDDKDVQLTSLNIIKEKASKPLADFINIKNKRVTLDFKSLDK